MTTRALKRETGDRRARRARAATGMSQAAKSRPPAIPSANDGETRVSEARGAEGQVMVWVGCVHGYAVVWDAISLDPQARALHYHFAARNRCKPEPMKIPAIPSAMIAAMRMGLF